MNRDRIAQYDVNADAVMDMPESAHAVLDALDAHGELYLDGIAAEINWTRSTAAKWLHILRAVGLVDQRPCVDRPSRSVYSLADPGDEPDLPNP